MTETGYRHRILIMDRSGSINNILAGMQSGLRELFGSEAAVTGGRATYSLWDFDDRIDCVYSFEPLHVVRDYLIMPRGWTALYDAVGDAVIAEGEKLAALPEHLRPADVTVIIASDGANNKSKRRTGPEVKAMLDHQQDVYGWRALYMGTNQDAFKQGGEIGARPDLTLNYANSDTGTHSAWSATAGLLSRAPVAAAAAGGYAYDAAERNLVESQPGVV